jgi:hypothetical protein
LLIKNPESWTLPKKNFTTPIYPPPRNLAKTSRIFKPCASDLKSSITT